MNFLVVALGAAAGGVSRYALNLYVVDRLGLAFPYGTFFINVSGSFLMGVVAELALLRASWLGPLTRLALLTGLLGGYTTFSSYSYETLALFGERGWRISVAYALGSVLLGIAACYAGMTLVRLITRSG